MKTLQTTARRRRTPKQDEQSHIGEPAKTNELADYEPWLCRVCGDDALIIFGINSVCGPCALERDKELRCIGCGSRYDDPADENKRASLFDRAEDRRGGVAGFPFKKFLDARGLREEPFIFKRVQKRWGENKRTEGRYEYVCIWCAPLLGYRTDESFIRKRVDSFIHGRDSERISPFVKYDREEEDRRVLLSRLGIEPGENSGTWVTSVIFGTRYGKQWKDYCLENYGFDCGVYDDPDSFPFLRMASFFDHPKLVTCLARQRLFYRRAMSYMELVFELKEYTETTRDSSRVGLLTTQKFKLHSRIEIKLDHSDPDHVILGLREGLKFGEITRKTGAPKKAPDTLEEMALDWARLFVCHNYNRDPEPKPKDLAEFYVADPSTLWRRYKNWPDKWEAVVRRGKELATDLEIEDIPAVYRQFCGIDLK